MKTFLPYLAIAAAIAFFAPSFAQAGGSGYSNSRVGYDPTSKFSGPRYHQLVKFPQRTRERPSRWTACNGRTAAPYLVKTVVVKRKYVGTSQSLTTIYKDVYSDGSCSVWTARD